MVFTGNPDEDEDGGMDGSFLTILVSLAWSDEEDEEEEQRVILNCPCFPEEEEEEDEECFDADERNARVEKDFGTEEAAARILSQFAAVLSP